MQQSPLGIYTYLGTTTTVYPYTLETVTGRFRRVVPFQRIKRIQAANMVLAGVHVEGGPFSWGQLVPTALGQKERLVESVLGAKERAPTLPTLVVTYVGGHGIDGLNKEQEYLLRRVATTG